MRKIFIPIILIGITFFLISQAMMSSQTSKEAYTYAQLEKDIAKDKVSKITVIGQDEVKIEMKGGETTHELGVPSDRSIDKVEGWLQEAEKEQILSTLPPAKGSALGAIFSLMLPIIIIVAFWLFIMSRMSGGGGAMQFGKSKAKLHTSESPKVLFKDVAGVDEAVQELEEIKDFLADPDRFKALGARIPKGVLLVGPPGTGKTLLARATAAEAGVPFFSISGSEFVEMFVGVGASRVRDLFAQAKAHKAAIIFIDEIDAVGRKRGVGMGSGNDEKEQTLNQLLVEMDGFEAGQTIILIGATNRPDVLDPALLRPGRFDRQVLVSPPDRDGRLHILKVHSKGKPMAKNVDLAKIASQTSGFTGADLANLVNEAAILAARKKKKVVGQVELEEGIMRVIVGPEKKSRLMSEEEKRVTAVHEMGHAFCSHILPDADPLHKISIIGRGMALGYVVSMPAEDRYMRRKRDLIAQIIQSLGGRAAEQVVFGEYTTGAENDLQKATDMARKMITRWGMSDKFAPRAFEGPSGNFLGGTENVEYSHEAGKKIDEEIEAILSECYKDAIKLMEDNKDHLIEMSEVLLRQETIESAQFAKLWAGESEESIFGKEAVKAANEANEAAHEVEEKASRQGLPIHIPGLLPKPNAEAFIDEPHQQ